MTIESPRLGCQTIYSAIGEKLFSGGWDSRQLFRAVTGEDEGYWQGRRVLDIGSNTSGLSVEIARRGASVLAIEPDPYKTTRALVEDVLKSVVKSENLDLTFESLGLFDAAGLGRFDTVMCLGLVYHFRDQQFVIDYLSTIDSKDLILSNQTHPGSSLSIMNRMDKSIGMPGKFWDNYKEPLSGWHPTRAMFERMMVFGGFTDVVAITDPTINFPNKPFPGVTNSSYYRATKDRSIDPYFSRIEYLPR
jgi:SAM-dependent methyltransferase